MCDTSLATTDGYTQDGLLSRTYTPEPEADHDPRPARRTGCAMRHVCIGQGLDQPEIEMPDALVYSTRIIRRGETLFRAGAAFRSIYTVRTGSFKSIVTHRDGIEQVGGFHFQGDVLGFDGLHSNQHEITVIALEDSTVCIVPFSLLEMQCVESRTLQHQVYTLMSAEIVRENGLMMLLGVMTAEERVAAFLLNIATRMQQRAYSASCFNLRMTREEIGSYLGVKLETVSRMLSRFQKNGMVRVQGRQIQILDADALRSVGEAAG